jgi:hypothetical protein
MSRSEHRVAPGEHPDPLGPHESVATLLARARTLRAEAQHLPHVRAEAYLRRAAELSLEAWARAVRTAPVRVDDVVNAVAA